MCNKNKHRRVREIGIDLFKTVSKWLILSEFSYFRPFLETMLRANRRRIYYRSMSSQRTQRNGPPSGLSEAGHPGRTSVPISSWGSQSAEASVTDGTPSPLAA